jgi:hypothetical protein
MGIKSWKHRMWLIDFLVQIPWVYKENHLLLKLQGNVPGRGALTRCEIRTSYHFIQKNWWKLPYTGNSFRRYNFQNYYEKIKAAR